ncbi:MAG: GtrA family protein [Pseudomonadota bacterium]
MQIARYFVVGGAAAIVDLGIYATLVYLFDVGYLLAGACGFLFATGVNYVLSIKLVFSSNARFSTRQEIILVYFVSGIGLILHQILLFTAVDGLDMHVLVGKIFAMGLVFLWNFGSRKYYVFAERR